MAQDTEATDGGIDEQEAIVSPPSLLMSPDQSPTNGPLTPGAAAIKLCPFNLVGRGVAGIDEMKTFMDDTKVFFGLLQIQVGSGHFARRKNIFIHFNSENHPKPLQRAKANKKLKKAQDLMGQFHISLTVPNKNTFTVGWVFSQVNQLFVADSMNSSNLQGDYKALMKQAAKEAEAQRKKLEEEKKRREEEMRLKAQKEEEDRLAKIREEEEAAKRAKEEAERKEREAREAEEKAKLEAEQAEKEKKENESKNNENNSENKDENNEKNKKNSKKSSKSVAFGDTTNENGDETKKKKKKGKKRRKKDDWSNDRPWTTQRVLKAVHADMSPFNWAIVAPHDPNGKEELKCVHWGHGSIANLREHLDETCVQYGIMRLAFGSGKFKRSHFVFFIWTPDSMTEKAPQEIRSKKNKERMKHVSWKNHMKDKLAPCNVTVVAESFEKVGVEEWILRVRNTVVVDSNGEDLTAESVKKALEEEKKWLEGLRAKQEEEASRKRAMEERERAKSLKKKEARLLAQKEKEAAELADSELADKAGQYMNKQISGDIGDGDDSKASDEIEDSQSVALEEEDDEVSVSISVTNENEDELNQPEPIVVKLSEEEIKKLEEERIKAEKAAAKARKKREEHLQSVLQSQMCYESIRLIHNEADATCWVLFEPKFKK